MLLLSPFAEPAANDVTAIHAGRVLDVDRGRYLDDVVIRITDGLIQSVGPADPTSLSEVTIDLTDPVGLSGIEEHTLRGGGLSGIDVSNNSDIANGI